MVKIITKNSQKKGNVHRSKVSVHSKLSKMLKNDNASSVTFVKHDGRKIVQSLNNNFTHTHKGKIRNIGQIVNNLHAIKHDLQCKYFTL